MATRIRNEHLQWTVDRLRLDHIYAVLEEIDQKATERASAALAAVSSVTPSHFGETIRTFSEQEGPKHLRMLYSERDEVLLQVETEDPLVAEAPQRFREMWHAHPGTLFLGLTAWCTFPPIRAVWDELPYMPSYWVEHFVKEKEALPWQEKRIYLMGIDERLLEIRDGEWILPLFQIGEPNLTAQALNRIRILVDMFLQAQRHKKIILEDERQRAAIGSQALTDIEEALGRVGSQELPPTRP